jgi:hypothetical protein
MKFTITATVKVRDVVEADTQQVAVKRFLAKYPATIEVVDVNRKAMVELAVILIDEMVDNILLWKTWKQGQEEGHTYFTSGHMEVRPVYVPKADYEDGKIKAHNIRDYL